MSDENQVQERGYRGEVGTATPSSTIKKLWRTTHGKQVDGKKPSQRRWQMHRQAPSLKAFARKQADEGNQMASDWLNNKTGCNNAKRSDTTLARIATEKQATKAAKKGKK
jgi:hypothetical protein